MLECLLHLGEMAQGAIQQNLVLVVTFAHQVTYDSENVVAVGAASAANEAQHLHQYKHLS